MMKSNKLAILLMAFAITAITPMFTSCSSGDDNEEDINNSENVNVSDVSEDGKDDVSDSGIEFIDDIEDDELTGDDIPLFKEKIDD